MLRLTKISRQVGPKTLVDGVSAELDPGEIVSFLGPTGSGKTSLLRLIMGLDLLDSGSISYGETLLSVAGKNLVAPHLRGFSLVFQDTLLLPFMSVQKSISLGLRRAGDEARRRLAEITSLLHLDGLERRPAWELSGGEQQRVALARSLLTEPAVLLLDEPFSNLDKPFKEQLFPALKAYLRRAGITTVFVTHDRHEAFYFSERMFVLSEGRLRQSATPRQLYEQPASRQAAELLGECNILEREPARAIFGRPARAGAGELCLIRPEHLELSAEPPPNGELVSVEFHGFYQLLLFRHEAGPELKIRAPAAAPYTAGAAYKVRLRDGAPVVVLS